MTRLDKFGLGFIFLAPLLPLLFVGYGFQEDWYVHLWMIKYQGAYFSSHLSFPGVYSTPTLIGMPTPMFYAHGLYKLIGFTASLVGGSLALRLWIFFVCFITFGLIWKLFKDLLKQENAVALSLTAIVYWNVYLFTCLYNRGAVAEFFGIHFLTWSFLIMAFYFLGEIRRRYVFIVPALIGIMAATHIITAYVAVGFLSMAFVFWWIFERQRLPWKPLAAGVSFAIAINVPWIYVYSKFGKYLKIGFTLVEAVLYPNDIDKWWVRLFPFPIDLRVTEANLNEIATPYLTAPVNVFLVGAVLLLIFTSRALRFGVLLWGLAGILIYVLTVSKDVWEWLPLSMSLVQFPYRLVTLCSLSFLGALILLIRNEASAFRRPVLSKAIVVLAMGALVNVAAKNYQAFKVMNNQEYKQNFDYIFGGFGGNADYGLVYFYPKIGTLNPKGPLVSLNLRPDFGLNFGSVPDANVRLKERSNLKVNVVTFPYNHIFVNGQIPQWEQGPLLFFSADVAAGEHTVQYRFVPPSIYVWLSNIGILIMAAGVLFVFRDLLKVALQKIH